MKIINTSPYPLPKYETPGSAGMDLRAHLSEPVTLAPLERSLIPTGLFIELKEGVVGYFPKVTIWVCKIRAVATPKYFLRFFHDLYPFGF